MRKTSHLRAIRIGLCLVAAVLSSANRARAATGAQVTAAILDGVNFLYKSQKGDNWEDAPPDNQQLDPNGYFSTASHYGGKTALVTYALLAAGEKPSEHPELQRAIKWLMTTEMYGTYAVGLRAQVWLLIEQSPQRDAARDADARFLLDSVIQRGPNAGFYGYSRLVKDPPAAARFGTGGPPEGYGNDRSNSQYGVLGMWALERSGAEIPAKYWEIVDKAWKTAQKHDGSWNYTKDNPSSAAMTAAGIATLFITQDYVMRGAKWEPCTGGVVNDNIETALLWMDKNIQGALTGGNFYSMYGVERIGTASGRKYFGALDWYQVGSDYLIGTQKAGAWSGAYGQVVDTAFAVLFLVRGRAPVMMNKLQYSTLGREHKETGDWNERPRDVANVTRWFGNRIESYFNWQVVNLSVPPEELHDSPILYMSGKDDLKLEPADVQKLRTFVEQGGLILANADCNTPIFARTFEKMGTDMFKNAGGYTFRPLPPNHVIYNEEQFKARRWKSHPVIHGLSNGVRELMLVVFNGDIGHSWQSDVALLKPEPYELAADIFLYAIDKQNLQFKGDTYIVLPNPSHATQSLKVARLQADAKSNWDPEPAGWARLSAIFHNHYSIDLAAEPLKLGQGSLAPYKIAHLTGTGRLTLTADQRLAINDFVLKGGTLIVDAAGGDAIFAQDAERELGLVFGKEVVTKAFASPLPPDSPIYATPEKITTVGYRSFASRTSVGHDKTPRLRGIPVADGRIGVIFSREDLSAGLVGQPVDGIIGYDPASATALMRNILFFAAKLSPTTSAASKEPVAKDKAGAGEAPKQ